MQVELGPVPAAWQRHPSMDPRPTLRPSLPFTAPLQVEARVTFSFLWPFWFLLPSLPLFYHCVFFVPRADLIFCFLFLRDLEAVVSLCHSWCLIDKLFVLVSVRELCNWDLTVVGGIRWSSSELKSAASWVWPWVDWTKWSMFFSSSGFLVKCASMIRLIGRLLYRC